ncbi:DNA polymerase domain-containing protein, partial [Salinispira pacifica]
FSAQSLEHVAGVVLGTGKTISAESGLEKIEEIERLRSDDPEALCRYCLHDAVLVSRILERTGLLALTIKRCLLIGVSLSRAWMSIRSFEFLYIEAMHRRGVAAPTLGVDALAMEAAPGGAILTPEPGLFRWVMVFDFKSLYPSVIRTFNIDPVSLIRGGSFGAPDGDESGSPIVAPNGARFSRAPGILPGILDRFFTQREEAKQRGDPVASYVYKIIMNSFYGVLGAPGCRFAGSELAGAITSLGQRVLRWCKRLLVEMGYTVIYGDTDSLFVLAKDAADAKRVFAEGRRLAETINGRLATFVRDEYAVESRLELEFEKVYERFFVPALRAPSAADAEGRAAPVRGRAKGYAGLRAPAPEERERLPAAGRIEIKGMEAIRRDWTAIAQELQLAILTELFGSENTHASALALSARIRELVQQLRAGRMDEKLVYTRTLRKSVAQYTRSQPPHVKAALLLPPAQRRGTVRYLMTVDGPQPLQRRTSPIDYDHYIDKQLRPIAQAFVEAVGPEVVEALTLDRQLPLFGG